MCFWSKLPLAFTAQLNFSHLLTCYSRAITMSHVQLSGTYTNFPAVIVIDASTSSSFVLLKFAREKNNVPRNVGSVLGIVSFTSSGPMVPTACRWFHSSLPFCVQMLSSSNVELNADSVSACQPVFNNGGLLPPKHCILHHLPVGHSWICFPHQIDSIHNWAIFVLLMLLSIFRFLYTQYH